MLNTRILLVPVHWTVVFRAGELRYGEHLVRPSSGSCLGTPNDDSNMLRGGALPDQKDVLELKVTGLARVRSKPGDKA